MSRQELSRSFNSTLIGRFTERPLSVPAEGFSLSFSSQPHSVNPALETGQLCLLNTAGRRVYLIHHIANLSDHLFHVGTPEAEACHV